MEGRNNKILLPSLLTVPALVLVWAIATQSPTTPQAAASKSAQSLQPSTYRTTAIELYRDYNSDAAATQARIGDRHIVVTGTVIAVSKDYLGQNLVLLDAGNGISTAAMTLAPDQNASAMQLRTGQVITVSCETMARYSDAPSGSNCALIEPRIAAQEPPGAPG